MAFFFNFFFVAVEIFWHVFRFQRIPIGCEMKEQVPILSWQKNFLFVLFLCFKNCERYVSKIVILIRRQSKQSFCLKFQYCKFIFQDHIRTFFLYRVCCKGLMLTKKILNCTFSLKFHIGSARFWERSREYLSWNNLCLGKKTISSTLQLSKSVQIYDRFVA